MKVLVIGSGAREHAITWKLSQSPSCPTLYAAPGNGGTAGIAENVPIAAEDTDSLLRFVESTQIDLTIVGPEGPLAAGIVDRFNEVGCLIFGPSQKAARIESSKAFAKTVMTSAQVQTAAARIFTEIDDALEFINSQEPPYVIKADGLASGKGVIMARNHGDANAAIRDMMEDKLFGTAGETVLVEEWLTGQEISVFAFVDGQYVSPLVAACDYKRVGNGDTGLNTGGMGSYTPPNIWSRSLAEEIRTEIYLPMVNELERIGSPYKGVLFAGLIVTDSGTKVIEFNCRLGDPETQVILPRLMTDLLDITYATALGRLSDLKIVWSECACVGIVLASEGYPGSYNIGHEIFGLDSIDSSVLVFHGGTQRPDSSKLVTSGGRVLTVTSTGETISDARVAAYDNIPRVVFDGCFHRNDIAAIL